MPYRNEAHKQYHQEYGKRRWRERKARGESTRLYDPVEYAKMGGYYVKLNLQRIKSTAKRKGIPFNLEVEDVVIPTHCPILGIELSVAEGKDANRDASPSVDRIIPALGYVKGNIVVISTRANRIKNDATLDELHRVVHFYEHLKSV